MNTDFQEPQAGAEWESSSETSSNSSDEELYSDASFTGRHYKKTHRFSLKHLENTSFIKCIFNFELFKKSKFKNVQFQDCKIKNCCFLKTKIENCQFQRCNLESVGFINSRVGHTDFEDCSLRFCSFEDSDIVRDHFLSVTMPGTHFLQSSVIESQIINSKLLNTIFFDQFESFDMDEASKLTARITSPIAILLYDPSRKGLSGPKLYNKLQNDSNMLTLRVSFIAQKIRRKTLYDEVEGGLQIVAKEIAERPLAQRLLSIIKNNPQVYLESHKIAKKVALLVLKASCIILPGGEDIPPKLYGAEEGTKTDWGDDYRRSLLELQILEQTLKRAIPIIGICRGFQITNVFFGAKLKQHVKGHKEVQRLQLNNIKHMGILHTAMKNPIFSAVYHHQVIHENNGPTEYLEHAVVYEEIIKASEAKHGGSAPMILLQFHPEFDGKGPEIRTLKLRGSLSWTMISNENQKFWLMIKQCANTYAVKQQLLLEIRERGAST